MAKSDDPSDRYEEILRRIEGRKQSNLDSSQQASLAAVLDGLNALGFLDDLRRKRLSALSLYGPKAVKGTRGTDAQQWAGAVLWHKPRGYHHYRTLDLLGVWAIGGGAGVSVMIGQKTLEFDSPVFNPESYYRTIKHDFKLYYADEGDPPSENGCFYTITYEAGERLAIRDAIQQVLSDWTKRIRQSE